VRWPWGNVIITGDASRVSRRRVSAITSSERSGFRLKKGGKAESKKDRAGAGRGWARHEFRRTA
jgi:hypothetical protein